MRRYLLLIPFLLLASSVLAQTSGSVRLLDEGVQQGKVENLDCIGSTITCARTGVTGTLTISGGGGGAPTDATYWTGAAHASLSAEINLGALGTGLVLNTAGTPSILAGNTCAANNFGVSISAAGVIGCAQPLFSNLSGTATTAQIGDDQVTYAKIQNVSAISKLLGRGSAAGAGDVEEITLGTNLSMSGTTLNATGGGGGLDHPAIMSRVSMGF